MIYKNRVQYLYTFDKIIKKETEQCMEILEKQGTRGGAIGCGTTQQAEK